MAKIEIDWEKFNKAQKQMDDLTDAMNNAFNSGFTFKFEIQLPLKCNGCGGINTRLKVDKPNGCDRLWLCLTCGTETEIQTKYCTMSNVKETAFFLLLVETNDRQRIAEMIATDLLDNVQTAFDLMAEYGYNGKDKINKEAVYEVADEIVKLKS